MISISCHELFKPVTGEVLVSFPDPQSGAHVHVAHFRSQLRDSLHDKQVVRTIMVADKDVEGTGVTSIHFEWASTATRMVFLVQHAQYKPWARAFFAILKDVKRYGWILVGSLGMLWIAAPCWLNWPPGHYHTFLFHHSTLSLSLHSRLRSSSW